MKKASIAVFDNDYRALAYHEEKEFNTIEEAKEYCDKKSWSGLSYHLQYFDGAKA